MTVAASPSKTASPCRPACLVLLLAASVASLSPSAAAARTWQVPGDAPTIQAGINLAQPGDDVLVAPGTYVEHDIALKGGVWVHSVAGPSVSTVEASGGGPGFVCSNLQTSATLEGFEIVDGRAENGGGILCEGSILVVRSCVISHCSSDNRGGGIYASESSLGIDGTKVIDCESYQGGGIAAFNVTAMIADCQILENVAWEGGGIAATGPEISIVRCVVSGNRATNIASDGGGLGCISPMLTIRDCLITHNSCWDYGMAAALYVESSSGVIEGCTVAHSYGVSPYGAVYISNSEIAVRRVIVAFNEGRGISGCWYSHVTFECCDVYGNTDGNDICGDDLSGNFSADPLFCNHEDYTLDENSPCLPGHNPDGVACGLVGARDVGCGIPPVTGACCFSDGSCLVEQEEYCRPQHGTYQGDGTSCTPNPCHPTPTKATTWGRIKGSFR